MPREWHYWSQNKLEILAEYLPAFNLASKSVTERIYIDVMAGQPENRAAGTGEALDGSARIALASEPGFTRWAFGELAHADELEADLRQLHPDKRFKIYRGDCNETVYEMLRDLADVAWAPTFAFLDQQGAELHWSTMEAIARFRRDGLTKAEQWILISPTMIYRGVGGSNGTKYAKRVDRMYGTERWRDIYEARREGRLTADGWRRETVNLLRWRLERELGYKHTARIPMVMQTNVEIYDMVFVTDHPAGFKIMSSLYAKAAEREPRMKQEALERAKSLDLYSNDTLFEMTIEAPEPTTPTWTPDQPWDPRDTEWWPEREM